MLNSILLILLLFNILTNNLKFIIGIFLLNILLNIIFNKNILKNIKKLKFLFYIYILSFFMYIFAKQEGEIIIKILGIYVTKEAILHFTLNFLRILNFLMVSWLIKGEGLLDSKLKRYKNIIDAVIELIPEVFVLFKKRLKIKSFLKHILIRIKVKNI